PLGEAEVKLTKKNLGWWEDKFFYIPDEVSDHFNQLKNNLKNYEDEWNKLFETYKKKYPNAAEQFVKVQKGGKYLIYLYKDELTNRMVGTTKYAKFLKSNPIDLAVGDKVKFMISGETEIGYKVIVEQKYLGLIYKNELFKKVELGDELIGFIKNIRDDNKIDVTVNTASIDEIEVLANKIYEKLLREKGSINISDKSNPEEIYDMFQVSKKAFKRAIGVLYSERKIQINPNSIVLAD
ncbi:MAG TPA: hypothetical protein PK649_12775, partial [Vicingus sp.]|nr:hypothetical protein [Vicingus sp.]